MTVHAFTPAQRTFSALARNASTASSLPVSTEVKSTATSDVCVISTTASSTVSCTLSWTWSGSSWPSSPSQPSSAEASWEPDADVPRLMLSEALTARGGDGDGGGGSGGAEGGSEGDDEGGGGEGDTEGGGEGETDGGGEGEADGGGEGDAEGGGEGDDEGGGEGGRCSIWIATFG